MTTLPTIKHALVIQGTEKEKQQACIEIRDWAVENGIPMTEEFKSRPYSGWLNIPIWYFDKTYEMKWLLLKTDSVKEAEYTIHHTVESFMKVFEVEESEPMFTLEQMENCFNEARLTHPMIGFKHKDFNEYKSTVQEFNPIELTNPKK